MSINSPGDASMATDRVGILSGTSFLSSATIRSKTRAQILPIEVLDDSKLRRASTRSIK